MMPRACASSPPAKVATTSIFLSLLFLSSVTFVTAFSSPRSHNTCSSRHSSPRPHASFSLTHTRADGRCNVFPPPLSRKCKGVQHPGTTATSLNAGAVTAAAAAASTKGIELAGVLYDSTSTAFDAWEWTANLGAPAALVAGAVLVTLSETREAMQPRKKDKNWVRVAKQSFRFLIMSSFALEVVSIFVSTVTGTVLLSHGEQIAKKAVGYVAPLELLHYHHEFEYLTIQIGFLQGLFNWLVAVALEQVIPKEGETKSGSRMNKCMACCIMTLTVWIQAFYNHHLGFYSDYCHVLKTYFGLFMKRFVLCWPIRPLALIYVPSTIASLVLAWRAFNSPPDEDDD